jgi:hypothetical protein
VGVVGVILEEHRVLEGVRQKDASIETGVGGRVVEELVVALVAFDTPVEVAIGDRWEHLAFAFL